MSSNNLNTLSDRVKFARQRLNISQAHLAHMIGVSQGTIGHIESGRNKGSKWVVAIAKALNVTVEWLLYGDITPASDPFILLDTKEYLSLPPENRITIEKKIIQEIEKEKDKNK